MGGPAPLGDVRFDHAAAAAHADALRRLATHLDRLHEQRRGPVARAAATWRGPHARSHHQVDTRLVAAAAGLVADLRAAAAGTERLAEQVRREDARRAAVRRWWRHERGQRWGT